MDKKEGMIMDAEVGKELLEIEGRLNNTLQALVREFSKDIQNTIKELFNKDIDHINEKLKHYQDNHKEHYDNDKDRRKDIDKLKECINSIEIAHSTKDKIEKKENMKKNTNFAFIGIIIAGMGIALGWLL